LVQDAVFRDRFETTGIDYQIRPVANPPFTVVPVPGKARQVGDECVARTGQAVEKRRFPHIGAPHEGNYGFHQMVFTVERKADDSGPARAG
jgi:hypothetical protein